MVLPPTSITLRAKDVRQRRELQDLLLLCVEFQKDVLDSKVPVLVDFWAEWCGPCKMVAPVLDELAKEYEGKIKIAKVDVDQNQQVAGSFNIRSIPALTISRISSSSKFSSAAVNLIGSRFCELNLSLIASRCW